MAWLFKSDWVTNPRNPANADLDNIAKDIKTWGGNVDAAGYNLLNLATLTTTANVGIGTGTPNYPLSIGTVGGAGNGPSVAYFGAPADNALAVLIARNGVANPVEFWVGVNQANLYTSIQSAQGGVGYKAFSLNPNGGYVGIGSTSPAYQCHIAGGSQSNSSGNYDDGGNKGGALFLDDSVAAGYGGGALVFGCGGKKFAAIKGNYQDSANNSVGFVQVLLRKLSTDTTMVPVMTFHNNGKVGIGTQGPTEQLDVNGNIQAGFAGWFKVAASNSGVDLSYNCQITRRTTDGALAFTSQNGVFDFIAPTQPGIAWYSTGGSANQQRGRLTYDGGQLTTGGGWCFQRLTDAGGFAANLVTIIQSTGKVGIGNSNPQAALQIGGVGGSLDTDVFIDRATSSNLARLIFSVGGSGVAGGAWGIQTKYDATFATVFGIWSSNYGYPLFKITGSGGIVLATPNATCNDASLDNSQHFVWYDEPGNRLVFRVRSSGGVLKTGYLTVS